jgi:hypothetical protein
VINLIMFGALAVLVLLRAPVAFRRPAARPAWLATVLGLLGLLAIGVFIPIPVADSWLGGTNILHLLRTALPVTAFWFLRDAVALQSGKRTSRGGPIVLVLMLAAQALMFFQIPDRGPSSIFFVDEHMIYVQSFVWAVVYVSEIVWIAVTMVVMLLPRWKGIYAAFIAGGLTTVAGGVALVAHCGQILAGAEAPGAGGIAWTLFSYLFYPGILVIVLGFVTITVRDFYRVTGWKLASYRLARALASYEDQSATQVVAADAPRPANPILAAYRAAIQLRDVESLGGVSLKPRDTRLLASVERRMTASHLSMAPLQ